jgi:hypothetical protein
MSNLYDIIFNFQFNCEFYKIHIYYSVIYDLCIMHHLKHSFTLDKTFIVRCIKRVKIIWGMLGKKLINVVENLKRVLYLGADVVLII